MIVTHETEDYIENPKNPSWGSTVPEHWGETLWVSFVAVAAGLILGFFSLLIADGIFINGTGMGPDTDASTLTAGLFFLVPASAGLLWALTACQLLPRALKPTFFTNPNHRNVHKQFMELDPAHRSFAQEAYDAVAAFDNPFDFADQETADLYTDALRVFSDTHEKLRRREITGDVVNHRDRIAAAKQALEIL